MKSLSPLVGKDRVFLGVIYAVLALMPIAALAGGLAFSPLLAICGLAWLLTYARESLQKPPLWGGLLILFCLWAWATHFYSPHISSDILINPVKFSVGMVFYIAGVFAIRKAVDLQPVRMIYLIVRLTSLLALLLLINLSTGFGLTFLGDPVREGQDIGRRLSDARMSTGNGITILALALVPVGCALFAGVWKYKALATVLVLAALVAAVKGGQDNVSIALILSVIVFGFTLKFPKTGSVTVTALAMIGIVFAPLLGGILPVLSETQIALLPFSWEYRIEMWHYASGRIGESFWLGHGFDAVRTFSDTFEARGFADLPYISLHPHNAGLHLWLETGAIGVALFTAVIAACGQKIVQMSKNSPLKTAGYTSYMFLVTFISSVSYGFWQDWWWSAGLSFLGCLYILTYLGQGKSIKTQ